MKAELNQAFLTIEQQKSGFVIDHKDAFIWCNNRVQPISLLQQLKQLLPNLGQLSLITFGRTGGNKSAYSTQPYCCLFFTSS